MSPSRTVRARLCWLGLAAVAACAGGGDDDPAPACRFPTDEQPGDGRDNDCDGLIDEVRVCATGDAAWTTIGPALAAAPSGTGLELCAGVYAERLIVEGKAVELRGEGAGTTFLDGGGGGTVLWIRGGGAVGLAGITVRNGDTPGGGGGIVCDGGAITLVDSALTGNRAGAAGGGLHARGCEVRIAGTRLEGNEGTPMGGGAALVDSSGEVVDSHVVGNAADDGGGLYVAGGAIAIRATTLRGNLGRVHGGAIFVGADATIAGNTIAGNRSGWTGGGVYVDGHAPTLRANTIEANTAVEEGGGVYLHESRAVLADNRITDNEATDDGGGVRLFTCSARLERNLIARNRSGTDGGGVKSSHLPSVFVDNEIVDNVAAWSGGGLELDNDASQIRGGLIARNQAIHGGGVHAMLWPWAGGMFEDVRITDNRAGKGGGLHVEDNFQPMVLRRVTIQGNTATEVGAGLYARTTHVTLTNALVRGNRAHREGGAIWAGRPSVPWSEPCPCPPAEPVVRVEFTVLHGNTAPTGAAVWTSLSGLTVASSILDGNSGVGVAAVEGAAPAWRYNDTTPASFQGLADPTGVEGNLATGPAFLDVGAGDFRLRAASACVDAGDPAGRDRDGSRADMGLFAGPDAP